MRARTEHRYLPVRDLLGTVFALGLVLGLAALGLRILHTVPPYLAPKPITAYATVAEAQRATGIRLWIPAYYPEYLGWPPIEVRAWTEPHAKVSITVAWKNSTRPVLWLEEWYRRPDEPVDGVPSTAQVFSRDTVALRDGIVADLVGFRTPSRERHYRITWEVEGTMVMLTAALSESEVLRMARSMHWTDSY